MRESIEKTYPTPQPNNERGVKSFSVRDVWCGVRKSEIISFKLKTECRRKTAQVKTIKIPLRFPPVLHDIFLWLSLALPQAVAALWLALPALIANPSAVIFGGGEPIDMGKKFYDGRRILGDGKTWKGLIGGGAAGAFTGIIQQLIAIAVKNPYFPVFSADALSAVLIVTVLGYGALIGDAAGSFIKRRMGIERGDKAFLLDQLSFLIIALFFVFLTFPSFFFRYFWNIPAIITLFVLTPILHRIVNIIGYRMGKKDVPW